MQIQERIPYETLLKQRASVSSSVPVTPSKTRPAWATARPNPVSDTWQASQPLPNRAIHPPLAQHTQAGAEEEWPDLSHLGWEGEAAGLTGHSPHVPLRVDDVGHMGAHTAYPRGGSGLDRAGQDLIAGVAGHNRQKKMSAHLADQGSMKLSSPQARPRWGSRSALPSRPHSRADANTLDVRQQSSQSSHLPQAARHSGIDSTAGEEQSRWTSGSLGMSQPNKPLHTHVSLDSLAGHADLLLPAQAWSRAVPEQLLPACFHTSLDELMTQGIIQDEWAALAPKQPTVSHRSLNHSRSSQQHHSSSARYARQISVPSQRQAPHDWNLDSADSSGRGGEEELGAASAAAHTVPSFASPTRSSAAKMQQRSLYDSPSRSRRGASSASLAGTSSRAMGMSQASGDTSAGNRPAPLTSTFRSVFHLPCPAACAKHAHLVPVMLLFGHYAEEAIAVSRGQGDCSLRSLTPAETDQITGLITLPGAGIYTEPTSKLSSTAGLVDGK